MKPFYVSLVSILFLLGFLVLLLQTETLQAKNISVLKKAVFAGGCFWCMEKPFEALDGVVSVASGYTGGFSKDPTYKNYAAGGHLEAIEIIYDPTKITYKQLLDVFWKQINPTDPDGQFVDRGKEYSTAIFYFEDDQKRLAEESKRALEKKMIFNKPIVTPIIPASTFYKAEDYHQDYYEKNPIRYWYYRKGSGRDQFLEKVWGKNDEKKDLSELKKKIKNSSQ